MLPSIMAALVGVSLAVAVLDMFKASRRHDVAAAFVGANAAA